MTTHSKMPVLVGGAIAAALFASSAFGHHGWSWAEADQIELRGTIIDIYIGQPHPTLQVEAEDGEWTVELGNPRQTETAGFVEGSAGIGDEIVALGNRSTDPDAKLMRAVRITVNDQTFDIYPDRIPSN